MKPPIAASSAVAATVGIAVVGFAVNPENVCAFVVSGGCHPICAASSFVRGGTLRQTTAANVRPRTGCLGQSRAMATMGLWRSRQGEEGAERDGGGLGKNAFLRSPGGRGGGGGGGEAIFQSAPEAGKGSVKRRGGRRESLATVARLARGGGGQESGAEGEVGEASARALGGSKPVGDGSNNANVSADANANDNDNHHNHHRQQQRQHSDKSFEALGQGGELGDRSSSADGGAAAAAAAAAGGAAVEMASVAVGDKSHGPSSVSTPPVSSSPVSPVSPSKPVSPLRENYADVARRRIKRARVALEEALDELGRSAVDELGLAPPAYMDLDFGRPGPEPVVGEDGGEGGGEGVEAGAGAGVGEERPGWLRQFKKGAIPSATDEILSGLGSTLGDAVEESMETVGEGVLALDDRVESAKVSVGEGVAAFDDRVERARASVETALNELGLAVLSDSAVDEDGLVEDVEGTDGGGGGRWAVGKSVAAAAARRWWLPERLRTPNAEELDEARRLDGGRDEGLLDRSPDGVSQKEKGKFFRRPLPIPSMQSQRAVAERAVKRAKDALGTAMDDLGLTRPPVGSALERFLHADEVLKLWRQEEELEDQMEDGEDILPGTDIGTPDRRIWVVTTAALPWMTGTSVNPLLRAAYLTRGREPGKVSLMIPWVGLEDQQYVLPDGCRYETRAEQEVYIRDWLRASGMAEEADDLDIAWYEARYHQVAGCIFPMGDITRLIPDGEADVCIMEEPEHLNWFRATGVNWSKKFTHVVGVIHTNYVHYTMADTNHWASGRVKAPFARAFNKVMARAYCDKVIKLSATLQKFAEEKETVTNVHGVRENFLIVGDERAEAAARGEPFPEGDRPYFLGKMLWEKGYDKLWNLLDAYQKSEAALSGKEGTGDGGGGAGGTAVVLSAYGSGPDSEDIRARAEEMGLPVKFSPATDHAGLSQYKTFVNPSESEVLCTTVAEALAMGKFVIIAEHASNEFFYQFPNTLRFKSQEEFNKQMNFSIKNDPAPLTPEQRHVLGWSAATGRLIDSARVTMRESRQRRRELDEAAWLFHYYLGSGRRGDRVRKIMAGGVVAGQNAHMEMVLKEEDAARREAEEMAAVSATASAMAAATAAAAAADASSSRGAQGEAVSSRKQ